MSRNRVILFRSYLFSNANIFRQSLHEKIEFLFTIPLRCWSIQTVNINLKTLLIFLICFAHIPFDLGPSIVIVFQKYSISICFRRSNCRHIKQNKCLRSIYVVVTSVRDAREPKAATTKMREEFKSNRRSSAQPAVQQCNSVSEQTRDIRIVLYDIRSCASLTIPLTVHVRGCNVVSRPSHTTINAAHTNVTPCTSVRGRRTNRIIII